MPNVFRWRVGGWQNSGVEDAWPRFAAAIDAQPGLSPAALKKALGVSSRTVSRYLARFRSDGRISGDTKHIYVAAGYGPPNPLGREQRTTSRHRPPAKRARANPTRTQAAAARAKPGDALLDGATAALNQYAAARAAARTRDERDDTTAVAPRHRPLLDTLAQLVGGGTLEPADLHEQAAFNAAAVRRARSRAEPAALPLAGPALEAHIETAPQRATAPVQVSPPTVYVRDEYGRPHAKR
jgi:hypothetical protein